MLRTIDAVLARLDAIAGDNTDGALAFELDGIAPDAFAALWARVRACAGLRSLHIGAAVPIQRGGTDLSVGLDQLTGLRSLELDADLPALPESIGALTQLERLALRGSSVAPYPLAIYRLERLRSLELRMAQAHDGVPIEQEKGEWHIGRLQQLQELILDDNSGLYCLPKTITQCRALRRISLRNAGMSEAFPPGFIDLPLEDLDLRGSGGLAWVTAALRSKPGLTIRGL